MKDIVIILILILFNGLLAMSEIALISIKRSSLEDEVKKGSRKARKALRLAQEPDKFLSTVQIGITVIGILTGIYSGDVLSDDLAIILARHDLFAEYAYTIAQTSIVVVVTYLTIIMGELIPKRIGMLMANRVAKLVAIPMSVLSYITSPFVWILSKSTALILTAFKFDKETARVTEAEIRELISVGTMEGEVQRVEQDIIDRVFLLGDTKVSALMTHRSEMVYLDVSMNYKQVKEKIKDNLFFVYPVVKRNADHIVGIVYLKDLIFYPEDETFDFTKIITEPVYFHESNSVYTVLNVMRREKMSHALVCDEYGNCEGLITLKDMLKGIVGAIEENHTEPDIIKRTGGEGWLVDGQCPFHDFLSYFDREDLAKETKMYSTISGLLLRLFEHIPQSGESAVWNHFNFEIVDMDGARIDKVLVTIEPEDD